MGQSNVVSINRDFSDSTLPGESMAITRQKTAKSSGFYPSLASLLSANLVEPDELAYGIRRGEVSQLAGVTNAGKSTVALNLGLALAANGIFPPFITKAALPRRVLYADFEATRTLFRQHIRTMLQEVGNVDLAKENFIPCADAMVSGEPFNLSRDEHIGFLANRAARARADLIVIDPVGVAFDLTNENDNAEVTKKVIKPLKNLARETNAAVLFSHHIGKPKESSSSEMAYAGRGASAWGALARSVFTITRDHNKGKDYIIVQCAKIKGRPFDPVLLKLNRETYWFEVCDEKPNVLAPLTAETVAEFVVSRMAKVKTEEIYAAFASRGSESTIKRLLNSAVKLNQIKRVEVGYYQALGHENEEQVQ